jgi:hypothetical protein
MTGAFETVVSMIAVPRTRRQITTRTVKSPMSRARKTVDGDTGISVDSLRVYSGDGE